MDFQDTFIQELIKQMGFKQGDPRLLVMAGIVIEVVDEVNDPGKLAEKIVNKIIEELPSKIDRQDVAAINFYFAGLNFDCMRVELRTAAHGCMAECNA